MPTRAGKKLTPSIPLGGVTPAASQAVAKISMVSVIRSVRLPGLITPGQRAAPGTRRPPSYMCCFSPRHGPLLAPLASTPPLSLVKITSVFVAKPVRSSVSNTFPMPASRCSINATSFARFSVMPGSRSFTFSNHSGGGWIGS